MADLFGAGGRRLLADLDFPEPWLGHVRASVELIDDLDRRIGEIERWLQRSGADHRYIPLLMSAPGIGWITGFTIAAEIGDIDRFVSPVKLTEAIWYMLTRNQRFKPFAPEGALIRLTA